VLIQQAGFEVNKIEVLKIDTTVAAEGARCCCRTRTPAC
jgi:hypothetical protein